MRFAALWVVLIAIALAFGFIWGRHSGLAEGEGILEACEDSSVTTLVPQRSQPQRQPPTTLPLLESAHLGVLPTTRTMLRAAPLADPMAAPPQAPAPRDANGVLTGVVLWADKSPLAGAIVVAEPDEPWNLMVTRDRPIDGTVYRPDPTLSVLNSRRKEGWLAANRIETTTDDDGRFRFEGLDARREHWVSAYAEGAEIDGGGGRFTQSACGKDVALTAVPVAAVTFKLRLPDGSEPDAAIVDDRPAEGTEDACKRNWFRVSPAVALKTGKRSVCIWSEVGAEEFASGAIVVDVTDGGPIEPIEVRLEPRLAITGRLVVPPGELLDGNSVMIMKYADSGPPDDDRMRAEAQSVAIRKSTGAFTLRPVGPGRYAVMVDDAFGVTRQRTVVDVVDRSVDVEIVLTPAPASSYIRIKVLANDGSTVTDASVRDRETSTEAVLQADGSYVLARHLALDLSSCRRIAGSRFLRVASATLGTAVVEYAPETDQEVVVRLAAPANLRLELVGRCADEETQYGCYLSGAWHQESLESADAARAEFVSGGLQPGDYFISVVRRRGDCTLQLSEPLRIVPGDNRHKVSLPESLTLIVDLSDLTDGTRVRVERFVGKGDSVRCQVNDSSVGDSSRTYRGLIAGRYTATAVDADGETLPMEFEMGGDTSVRLRKGKADSVRIIDPGEALAGHGIVSGDILYGFGDIEWQANPGSAIEAFKAFQGSLDLRVRRNGRDLRIPVAASAVAPARWTPCIR